ncbi:MAG: hypothetical protein MJ252_21100 [archaeon]|nr:hypothetical protein [archaeon]
MAWVDKDLLPPKKNPLKIDTGDDSKIDKSRSIFHIGDFRHNVNTEKMARQFDTKILQVPRKFFEWNDGTTFNPKYKKDI